MCLCAFYIVFSILYQWFFPPPNKILAKPQHVNREKGWAHCLSSLLESPLPGEKYLLAKCNLSISVDPSSLWNTAWVNCDWFWLRAQEEKQVGASTGSVVYSTLKFNTVGALCLWEKHPGRSWTHHLPPSDLVTYRTICSLLLSAQSWRYF